MPRPLHALVHTAALTHNLKVVQRHAGVARLWAVVKANAYGHGIEHVYAPLRSVDGFAVLETQEAERLRHLGWTGPILLLEGVFDKTDLDDCARLQLWQVVHCREQIDMLTAHRPNIPHPVFLKLNTGMNRLGFSPAEFRRAWQQLDALPQVNRVSLMTHFSDADGAPGIQAQREIFQQATDGLPGERSLCNSAATLRFGAGTVTGQDWVRAGLALYGSSPNFPHQSTGDWGLTPVLSLRTRLIAVQHLRPGAAVGYGSRFVADTSMVIGIAACGYADGYPRSCETGTPVLVDGILTRTVGRISMDMIAVDLTAPLRAGKPTARGSEVVLWGCASAQHGSTVLPIEQVARHGGTVAYELMAGLTQRVPVHVEAS